MRQTDLVERVQAYDPDADEALLNKAYVYAMTAHGKQFRASGDPYFAHPLEVAAILTDLKLDVPTIVTALLHDTIEDTLVTYDDIKENFGEEIANLVDGVTKLSQLEVFSERTKQAENFRKLMLAITERHPRAAGQAGRPAAQHAHAGLSSKSRRSAAASRRKRVDIYAPLAGRIGMQNMREELEDLAFAELDPEARNSIVTHFARLDMVGGDRVGRIADQIKRKLAEHGMEAWVYGRGKRPFSIWRKLQTKKLNFEQLSDIFGFRVIVQIDGGLLPRAGRHPHQLADGAGALQGFHLHAQDQRLSLHPHHGDRAGKAARRNPDPHPGHARHRRARRRRPLALSRACARSDGNADSATYGWLRDMVDLLERGDSAEEVLEHSRLAMYQDQVFCFTPKGEPDLAAARRHADRFRLCGAYRSGQHARWAPRSTAAMCRCTRRCNNGDQVEIIATKDQHAVAAVGAVRGHGPGAGRNPPLPAPCPARRACQVRPQDPGKDLCRRRRAN